MSTHENLVAGVHCLCYHPQHAWVSGIIDGFDGKYGTVSITKPVKEQLSKLTQEDIFVCDESAMAEDVNDLLNLSVLHDGTLLNCLRVRYFRDVVYTNIGAIVVALNPFNFKIPWYMDDKMPDYLAEGEAIQRNLPHSWAVAHTTYYEMRRDGGNQSILVSGESGAGKTEAAKIVMKYLAAVSALQATEEEEKEAGTFVGLRMMQSNPILEAFGNAKTVRNDNSSRFGKLMCIKFNAKGMLTGAEITKYLLEKSRIITSALNERVYHAFYLVLQGRDRERYGLSELSTYRNVMSGKVPIIDDVDDAEEYDTVNKAMEICGIKQEDMDSVWRVVGAVLKLLNVEFISSSTDTCEVDPKTSHYITEASGMLGISAEVLQKEFTTTTLKLREGPVVTTLTKVKAIDARDSFCKAIYDNLFGYLVKAINKTINTMEYTTWVALLDIFGFEDFKVNSFEQLCINLTNETLQRHYNYFIFTRDMDECREEGIDVTEIAFPDNSACVDMIGGKGGILSLLDEDCLLAKATDQSFLDKISDRFAGKTQFFERPRISKAPCFRVVHYAGTVTYEVAGSIEKNRDTLKDAFKLLVSSSEDSLIKTLLPMPNLDNKSRYTVGGFFRSQLNELMELIQSTNPHWIRCIKPHPAKKPLHFDGVQTLTQLRSSGVLGTVQIRKAGYPIRIPTADFARKYKVIVFGEALDFSDAVGVSRVILKIVGFDTRKAQMGKTRVFLKSDAYQQLEVVKKQKLQVFVKVVVCGSLVSLARMRTAALLRCRSMRIVQAFLAARSSQHLHREKDYISRKDMIISNVIQLLGLQRKEEAVRVEMLEERDLFYDNLTAKRNRLVEDLYEDWLAQKPQRDAAAIEEFMAAECRARDALISDSTGELRRTLLLLEGDYDDARRREEEREAAARAAEERRRLQEEEARREARRCEEEAARAEAARRREETRRLAIALWDERKKEVERQVAQREQELQRTRDGVFDAMTSFNTALILKKQERLLRARERARYPTPQFRPCGVDALRDPVIGLGGLRGSIVSPTHPAYCTARSSSPTLGTSISNNNYYNNGRTSSGCASLSPNGKLPRHGRFSGGVITSYVDPLRKRERLGKERIQPDRNDSLETVRRLRSLQTLCDSAISFTPKPGGINDPLNPYSGDWKEPSDGVVTFPDGSSFNLQDAAVGGSPSMPNGSGSGGRGRYVPYGTMSIEP
ncbi:putative myosin heavy chain [Trypanosoma grayi]|uniref:putative myosin heavy chain n=1 Tax=Trypanosoma grayi TaxID=71804 RepID=UPI0004F46495|nr:putative myosin heavy chain [Trypanosoma grayi]KEG11089.1 putative myosin heavy chain [Trypanosoma grayi]